MSRPVVGVIGMGFVGGAVFRGFSSFTEVRGFDIDPRRSTHSLREVCDSDVVFLCLPTPMPAPEGGPTVLDALEETCAKLAEMLSFESTVFVLKSTVPIGTTQRLSDAYGLRLVHNPEFLTAANANIDFITPSRIVLGAETDQVTAYVMNPAECGEHVYYRRVVELYQRRFPGVPIYHMTREESEAVKYIANCFLAVKVAFFNEMRMGMECSSDEFQWGRVMEAVLADGRIGRTHYQVPGDDGMPGFGGTCFPKDISSLIEQIRGFGGIEPRILEAAWTQNKHIRPGMDWFQKEQSDDSPQQRRDVLTYAGDGGGGGGDSTQN